MRNYMVVVHYKLIDKIDYLYYETLKQAKEVAKEFRKNGNKVLRIYKIEEVK